MRRVDRYMVLENIPVFQVVIDNGTVKCTPTFAPEQRGMHRRNVPVSTIVKSRQTAASA